MHERWQKRNTSAPSYQNYSCMVYMHTHTHTTYNCCVKCGAFSLMLSESQAYKNFWNICRFIRIFVVYSNICSFWSSKRSGALISNCHVILNTCFLELLLEKWIVWLNLGCCLYCCICVLVYFCIGNSLIINLALLQTQCIKGRSFHFWYTFPKVVGYNPLVKLV